MPESIERKTGQTVNQASIQGKTSASNSENVLNSYRSYTYNFTLAALPIDSVSDPSIYRNNDKKLGVVICKSGGKGGEYKFAAPPAADAGEIQRLNNQIKDSAKGNTTAAANDPLNYQIALLTEAPEVVTKYNASDESTYDYYIDDVEISTIMAPNERSLTTLVNAISFTVFEPFSINGFYQTLMVAANATGYVNYMNAVFLLKVEFRGYPDSDDINVKPEIIDKTTRYIPFQFSKIEVDVTQEGTRYRCTAVTMDQFSFGESELLKGSIQMKGNTVKDILESLMKNLTDRIYADAKSSSDGGDSTPAEKGINDEYKIQFPVIKDGKWDFGPADNPVVNDIGKSTLAHILVDRIVYAFQNPDAAEKSGYKFDDETTATNAVQTIDLKLNDATPVTVFPNGARVSTIINSVIRDSNYLSDILKAIPADTERTVVDENGMIDFWRITTKVEHLKFDPKFGRTARRYTFIVSPYKIHYTEIPGYQKDNADPAEIKKLIVRNYNYIYTGQNLDVLNFKLNFNSLYYEGIAAGYGNNQAAPASDAAAPGDSTKMVAKGVDAKILSAKRLIGMPLTFQSSYTLNLNQHNAIAPKKDPFSIAARNVFNSVMESSKYSMLKGDLEILGDPLYLVTGGLGNYFPDQASESPVITSDGEVNHNYGHVLITLNFKNPRDIDIRPFKDNGSGLALFDPEKLSFTGIYRINKAKSVFKDGVFRQYLEINRMVAFDLEGSNNTISDPKRSITTRPNPVDQKVPDAGAAKIVKSDNSIIKFLKGIGNLESSIQTAVSTIENKISGAITSAEQNVANSINNNAAVTAIKQGANEINSKIQGVNVALSNASSKLGLTPRQLLSLKPAEIASLIAVSALIPKDVNIVESIKQGVIIKTPSGIANLPPEAPAIPAPTAETPK